MSEHYTVTRRIEIDMAHRVPHHGSKCFQLHGHRYKVEATVRGPVVQPTKKAPSTQTGMVIDFGFLKTCMMKHIHDLHDHGTTLWIEDSLLHDILDADSGYDELARAPHIHPLLGLQALRNPIWKVYVMANVPTAENLAQLWYEKLKRFIPDYMASPEHAKLCEVLYVDVWETPNCIARYPA